MENFLKKVSFEKYSSNKDSGVEWLGEIPEHWRTSKLRNIGVFSASGIDKYIKKYQSLVKIINFTDVYSNKNFVLDSSYDFMIVSTEEANRKKHLVNLGDLIFLPSSETYEDLGSAALINENLENTSFSYHVIRFRFQKDFNHSFKKYLTNNDYVLTQFSRQGKGTTRKIIGRGVFKNIQIIVPPKEEQTAIAEFLDRKTALIDKAIDIKEKQIELLKERRQILIHKAVTRGLDPNVKMKDSGVEWIGKIPEHWEVKRLKYVSEIVYGISPHEKTYNNIGVGVILVNGPAEYSDTEFGFTKAIKWTTNPSKFAKQGSLLFCLRGSTTGRLNICHTDLAIGRGCASIVTFGNQDYLTNAIIALKERILGTFKGSTFPSITSSDLDNYILPNPPLNDQNKISLYLKNISDKIEAAITQKLNEIIKLKEYKATLINSAVTGKIKIIIKNE